MANLRRKRVSTFRSTRSAGRKTRGGGEKKEKGRGSTFRASEKKIRLRPGQKSRIPSQGKGRKRRGKRESSTPSGEKKNFQCPVQKKKRGPKKVRKKKACPSPRSKISFGKEGDRGWHHRWKKEKEKEDPSCASPYQRRLQQREKVAERRKKRSRQ